MKPNSRRPRSPNSHLQSPPPDPSQPLLNPRHEAFAQIQAAGQNGTKACQAVFRSKRRSAKSHAAELRARPEVIARIRHLQSTTAQATVMGLREILEFLTKVKRTPIGQVDTHSDLVHSIKLHRNGKTVWMLDKRACVELAARLQGFLSRNRALHPPTSTLSLPPASNAASQPLANAQHEKFACRLAFGRSALQACFETYNCTRLSAQANAQRLTRRPEIIARVRSIQSESASAAVMGRREILEFLTRIVRTPVGQLDEQSDLVQRLDTRSPHPEFSTPNKLACIELVAKLLGLLRSGPGRSPREESDPPDPAQSRAPEPLHNPPPGSPFPNPTTPPKVFTHEDHLRWIAGKRAATERQLAAEQASQPNPSQTFPDFPDRSGFNAAVLTTGSDSKPADESL